MIACLSRWFCRPRFVPLMACCVGAVAASLSGCGGGPSGPVQPTLTGNTAVTVLAESTANDQVSRFFLRFSSLTLTSQSGETVTVFSTLQSAEFMHLNGRAEPLITVSLPQNIYTSATVTFNQNLGDLTCVGRNATAKQNIFNSAVAGPPGSGTVKLPEPITVTGTSMVLALNLQVSDSVTAFNCISPATLGATLTPTFNLTPVTIAAQPTNVSNGRVAGLLGSIGTVAGSGFSVKGEDGPVWQIGSASNTVFEGVSGAAQLVPGMAVEVDAAIQGDGSLLATRVAVDDADTTDLSTVTGPIVQVPTQIDAAILLNAEGLGPVFNQGSAGGAPNIVSLTTTKFQTSGELTNVQSLPFTANFSVSNMVPGQDVFVTSNALTPSSGLNDPLATSMTLLPQTIDGTVSAVSSSGGFTTYTVMLAPYDLFPDFAVQPGQTTSITNPNTVVVYADSNTQVLDGVTPAVGGVLRFNGLVFNDGGTLRMDCSEIMAGVKE